MKKWQLGVGLLMVSASVLAKDFQLLNVSYDPTREFYEQYDKAFSAYYKQKTGDNVVVRQSHGGSGKQATSVINGIRADVVTLALQSDVDAIAQRGRIDKSWQKRLPDNSAPYTSTIVFLVRKGNPKGIHDWNDLIKPGVNVITPNPKTSGGARWNYLAAWGYALDSHKGDPKQAEAFVRGLYKNVQVQDSGARGATNTFVERGIGDVLIAWENEAYLAVNKLKKDQFEIITPKESILAEPTVSVVDKVVDEKGTRPVAEAYLKYLYSPQGQEIIAQNYYRPRDPAVEKKYASVFKPLHLFTVDEKFGGWANAQKTHFSDGGTYDQIMKP
ncbi:sulfate ABC transporter substrate-binding protein [Rosenbergiella collisarenosi]|uniref:sulfate ABC transporter substrate-binding protein n=1 Tax=Rosenbergiella collisarenosi TaxID=1544695 RepID=UPI001BDAF2CF|nr:sulfate ABC transporter substrate-binding protein [Rosenbergiella collisarenosi]MBT0721717.1 sulfate ABC transporter substrate-binding protein [Rosenbergiella collisarenosi]